MSVDLTTPSLCHLHEITNKQLGEGWGASPQVAIKPTSWTFYFPASPTLFHPSLWQQGVRLLSRFMFRSGSLPESSHKPTSDPEWVIDRKLLKLENMLVHLWIFTYTLFMGLPRRRYKGTGFWWWGHTYGWEPCIYTDTFPKILIPVRTVSGFSFSPISQVAS